MNFVLFDFIYIQINRCEIEVVINRAIKNRHYHEWNVISTRLFSSLFSFSSSLRSLPETLISNTNS